MVEIQSLAAAMQPKPLLHVECSTRVTEKSPKIIADEVTAWLRLNYAALEIGQVIDAFPEMLFHEDIDFIAIADITSSVETYSLVRLDEIDIVVNVFQLYSKTEDLSRSSMSGRINGTGGLEYGEDDETPQAKVTDLPNLDLDGMWKSLIFDEPVQFKLLNFILRMISFTARQGNHHTNTWNRIVLLHGPPGTGKTSLCRALAQKLSIRLGDKYHTSKLVEFDAHSLFSKFFSESGKLVTKLFGMIESLLRSEENTFVCVFIDEVESLASARQHSAGNHEPRDALRAVNALLIAIDRLRHHPNVVILCTSNLVKAMDPAFLDRVDIKQYIPQPCARARYEIYRTCYIELAKCGLIAPTLHFTKIDAHTQNDTHPGASESQSPNTLQFDENAHVVDDKSLPEYRLLQFRYWRDEGSIAWKLWTIAEDSAGLSGRALRQIPTLALAMYTRGELCSMDEALIALSQAVKEEKKSKKQQLLNDGED